METTKLRRFAQYARRTLMELVEARLQLVLQTGSAARRENTEAIKRLEEVIKGRGEAQVIERVAYTWFNRFCALRFMDVNRYTRIGVVSPAEGQFQPEILAEAKMGHIDDDTVPEKIRQQIFELLEGKSPSHDPQGEAYRLLVVAACNAFHRAMPFLFERIDDYTELLMPDDLLSGNSILAYTREAMTPDACKDSNTGEPIVEVIGWLYQFYISEKKDAVFEGLKRHQKITPENIPAATQLFTPHWIVRYLVENSLGRLWMLNRPASKLAENMDYYIEPEQPETDFLKISSPEEIKICDPACGSGHMLTYAFDLLYAIYEEEGVDVAEIPEKILTHNLYGIEIDERAGELAAFALTMKARAKQRRFFKKGIKPNICVLEKVKFDDNELTEYMDFVGRDLFTAPLQTTLRQFQEADNFGSLIRPDATDVEGILRVLEAKNVSGQLFITLTHKKVLQALLQANYLSPKYQVVIANPPYMGSGNMNGKLLDFAKSSFPDSKSDLYAIFMERSLELTKAKGTMAMINMQSWMFLPYFEGLRSKLFTYSHISTLLHIGPRGFDTIGGDVVSTVAFCIEKSKQSTERGIFIRVVDGRSESEKSELFKQAIRHGAHKLFFKAATDQFDNIPGAPVAYWLGKRMLDVFGQAQKLGDLMPVRTGLQTGDNAKFVRFWHEVSLKTSSLRPISADDARSSLMKWFPLNAGGTYRRWYGNNDKLVDWHNDGQNIRQDKLERLERGEILASNSKPKNESFYFRPCVTWTRIKSKTFGVRICQEGSIFDMAGSSAFPDERLFHLVAGFLNSKIADFALGAINPTVTTQPGDVARFPWLGQVIERVQPELNTISKSAIDIAKLDWDSFETSWDFTCQPLLNPRYRHPTLKTTYLKLHSHWREMVLEMQRLEEENNRIFIEAYGLKDELDEKVNLNEITLTCNPRYRYGGDKSEEELEAMLLVDTMRELVSYAVGCMFGRYSLDMPGLILSNQGETLSDYLQQVPEPRFSVDEDNVIPVLGGDWFIDDIAERFRQFLRVAFGEAHYEENLRFIETALGKKGKPQPIRDYFLKDFYNDHVKRYKKRPIYWLFSSPKGTFNALIYLHRYRPDTVSIVLQYLRDFRSKLASERDHQEQMSISGSASAGEKTKALKSIDELKKMLAELDDYERQTLYPLATHQVALDLDDGVKVNYMKFGTALKKIPGLDAKDEE